MKKKEKILFYTNQKGKGNKREKRACLCACVLACVLVCERERKKKSV